MFPVVAMDSFSSSFAGESMIAKSYLYYCVKLETEFYSYIKYISSRLWTRQDKQRLSDERKILRVNDDVCSIDDDVVLMFYCF
jgi:hypothetical protein